ncbi:MAG: helicase-related protein [Terriglobales bacterium]
MKAIWADSELRAKLNANRREGYFSFEEARALVRSANLKSIEEYAKFQRNYKGKLPTNLPSFYKGEFVSWQDLLGASYRKRSSNRLPYMEARELARSKGFKSIKEYERHSFKNIPMAAQYVYKKEWEASPFYKPGMGKFWVDFLNLPEQFLPFEEARQLARQIVRDLKLETVQDFGKNRPKSIPAYPAKFYKEHWVSWVDFLGFSVRGDGVNRAVIKEERLKFLKELVDYSNFLSEADLLLIARNFNNSRTSSLLHYLQAQFPNKALSEIISLLKSQGLQVVSDVPSDDEIVPVTKDILPLVFTDDHALVSAQSLRIMDWAASKGLDPVAIQWLANSQLNRLRNKYVLEGEQAVKGMLAGDGEFLAQIKEQFLREVEGAEAISVPEWQLKVDGFRREPTRMQKMTAYQITQRRTWGNWSGAGAGKTAAAGLAAFATNSEFTLIVGVNSTLQGWRDQLHKAFGHHAKVIFDISKVKPGRGMFLIWNYEKFQTLSPTPTEQVAKLKPDMIVLDEVQFIKHRSGDDESIRRVALLNLLRQCPTSKVLCMSATPVINDLSEGVSLAEIAKGRAVKLSSRRTISNAMTVHYELVGSGLRYLPEYKQEMKQIPVTHTIPDWDQTNLTLLGFEQKLVPHRLDAVKDKIRPGTIIYTYYLEGVEDVAMDYVRSLGFSVAKYTGNENAKVREQIQKKFVRGDIDVLIGSQAMAVGVDGLQERCDRMIFLSLPWTYAAYEQIIGRVYRTGSKFESVEVFIPQVLTTSHKATYDTFRWSLLRDKRTLAECATDGVIPNVISLNRNAVLEMVRKEMEQEGKSAKGAGAP